MQIAFGQGMVQGMLNSQHALQWEAQVLHQECTTLTDENTWLRFIAGLPPRRSRFSAIIPASAVHCPAGAQPQPKVFVPRLPIDSPLQPSPPSPLSCLEV